MKQHKHLLLLLGAGLLALSNIASAGVAASKHNLGSSGTTNTAAETADTCVFCHTPHKGAGATVPLWNKGLPSSAGYTPYSSSTIDGTTDFTGSTSMACLSCHDGSQAMDNIVNAPGSNGYTAGGADVGYTWSGATVDAGGTLTAGAITNIGGGTGALGDDHPVAIQYAGGGLIDAGGGITDPDFVTPINLVIGGERKWWFDVADATRIDASEIRLFTREIGSTGTYEPFVECASCHDPHNSTTLTFLRVANTNSAVCTACHNK